MRKVSRDEAYPAGTDLALIALILVLAGCSAQETLLVAVLWYGCVWFHLLFCLNIPTCWCVINTATRYRMVAEEMVLNGSVLSTVKMVGLHVPDCECSKGGL